MPPSRRGNEMTAESNESDLCRRGAAAVISARAPALCIVSLLIVVFAGAARAQPAEPSPAMRAALPRTPAVPSEIGIDQKLDERVPLDAEFRDEAGKTVRLGDYFGRKPVLLVLVYYDCPMLCTLSLNGVLHSLQTIRLSAGQDFEVVTVSFDPREKPELAAAKKRVYLTLYNRSSGWAGWHFLTGDEGQIRRLTSAVGFRYKWDAASGQYAHATGIMILTPEGKLSRYFYGIDYPPPDLRLSLVEASDGKIGSAADEVLLYCFHYDPATGRYGLVITRVLQLAGAATVLVLGGFVVVMAFREKKKDQMPQHKDPKDAEI